MHTTFGEYLTAENLYPKARIVKDVELAESRRGREETTNVFRGLISNSRAVGYCLTSIVIRTESLDTDVNQ